MKVPAGRLTQRSLKGCHRGTRDVAHCAQAEPFKLLLGLLADPP